MSGLLRRDLIVAAGAALILPGSSAYAEELMTRGPGFKRSGDKLIVQGELVEHMLAVALSLNDGKPLLFEVCTTCTGGFVFRGDVARAAGITEGSAFTARLADMDLSKKASVKIVEGQWGLPAPLAGVIGLDVFDDLSVGLDFPSAQLLIGPVDLPPADGLTIFDYTERLAPTVPVRIGDVTFEAVVGTGQIRAPMLVTERVASQLKNSGRTPAGEATDGSKIFELTETILIQKPLVGDVDLSVRSVVSPPPDDKNSIGAEALREVVVKIDQRNKRIQISKG